MNRTDNANINYTCHKLKELNMKHEKQKGNTKICHISRNKYQISDILCCEFGHADYESQLKLLNI